MNRKQSCQSFMTSVLEFFVSRKDIDDLSVSLGQDNLIKKEQAENKEEEKPIIRRDEDNLRPLEYTTMYSPLLPGPSSRRIKVENFVDPYAFRKRSFRRRMPGVVMYESVLRGPLGITVVGEVKGRSGDSNFPDGEVGHILDICTDLMENVQLDRSFLYSFLTDCERFQFFKISRTRGSSLTYEYSDVYHQYHGWNVSSYSTHLLCSSQTCSLDSVRINIHTSQGIRIY